MRPQTAVLIPTRDRPEKLGELLADWRSTTARPIVLVDDDQIEMYDDLLTHSVKRVRCSADIVASVQPRARLVAKLNGACRLLGHRYKYVGFMGDDHRPRTDGWDERLTASIEAEPKSTGIAYGDDLHQGERLPTAVMMSANIVRALGYMVPPVLQHYFVDDFWRDLGLGVGCLTYRPDVVIEHMHPDAEKAERDDLYDETQPLIHPDTAAWAAWKSEGSLDAAVARIRRIRERP